jgi:hypothetical protein
MADYNPYDILTISINGKNTYARPTEFDSVASSNNSTKNSFGFYVKPCSVVTTCPDCGQGIILSVKYPDPPFPIMNFECYICESKRSSIKNPFVNPLTSGIIKLEDLNPNIYRGNKIDLGDSTVEERLSKDASETKASKMPSKVKKDEKNTKTKAKNSKKGKSSIIEHEPVSDTDNFQDFVVYKNKKELEPAEGMEGLEDFDDQDFIEP